jgi:hypothetical protein
MNDTTPAHLSPDQLAWLRHAAALGHAEPQALLHLLGRVEALEAAAAGAQPDKLDRLAEVFRAEDEADPQTLHTVALRMVDTLERMHVLPEILDTLRRTIREPMDQPTPKPPIKPQPTGGRMLPPWPW